VLEAVKKAGSQKRRVLTDGEFRRIVSRRRNTAS